MLLLIKDYVKAIAQRNIVKRNFTNVDFYDKPNAKREA
jgi:hypothetical protein